MQEVLEHLDQYGLVGASPADGAIVGFTLGGRCCGDTLYIHIEKADRDYPGAYQMLCRQFCTAYADGLAYVNREEDIGGILGPAEGQAGSAPGDAAEEVHRGGVVTVPLLRTKRLRRAAE